MYICSALLNWYTIELFVGILLRYHLHSTINKSLESISKKAQLDKKITFHMARHTWAVNALERGMSISMISSLLGHSCTMVTEKAYLEFRNDTKAEAVRILKFNI